MKNPNNTYRVCLDMNISFDMYVSAKSQAEANKKAYDRFVKSKIKRRMFNFYTDKL